MSFNSIRYIRNKLNKKQLKLLLRAFNSIRYIRNSDLEIAKAITLAKLSTPYGTLGTLSLKWGGQENLYFQLHTVH